MLTTTMAKKNLNWDAKKVVKYKIMGKLNTPSSPNSKVKKPKTLIFKEDKSIIKNGKINDMNMSTYWFGLAVVFVILNLKVVALKLVFVVIGQL